MVALLVYNDYRCDHPSKREKLIRLITSCKEKGAMIDALGLQAHHEYGRIPFGSIQTTIDAMRDIGVKIVFSKLDRNVTTRGRSYPDNGAFREEMKSWDPYPGTPAPTGVLKSQAEPYASCSRSSPITRTTSPASVSGTSTTARPGSTSGPGNAPTIPLLFDRNRMPKPALQAVLEVPGKSFYTRNHIKLSGGDFQVATLQPLPPSTRHNLPPPTSRCGRHVELACWR